MPTTTNSRNRTRNRGNGYNRNLGSSGASALGSSAMWGLDGKIEIPDQNMATLGQNTQAMYVVPGTLEVHNRETRNGNNVITLVCDASHYPGGPAIRTIAKVGATMARTSPRTKQAQESFQETLNSAGETLEGAEVILGQPWYEGFAKEDGNLMEFRIGRLVGIGGEDFFLHQKQADEAAEEEDEGQDESGAPEEASP